MEASGTTLLMHLLDILVGLGLIFFGDSVAVIIGV
jgi:hypothetical protein